MHRAQVGSGPSGLVAALTLAQNGVPIRIIEKESNPHLGLRGSGLTVCIEGLHECFLVLYPSAF